MKKLIKFYIPLFFLVFFSCAIIAKPSLQFSIDGITGKALANAEKRLLARQKSIILPVNADAVAAFVKDAPTEIMTALKPYGYFFAKVDSSVSHRGEQWLVAFKVIPGRPVLVAAIDIKINGAGKRDPIFQEFLRNNSFRSNEVLETYRYDALKQNLINIAMNNGYLFPKIEKSAIRVDLKKYSADIILYFNTGEKYRFGKVHFSPSPFSEQFLRRFLSFKEGDYYSEKLLEKMQNDLSQSNFFQGVTIVPQREKAENNAVPIDVNLVPRKAKQYEFGLGFGTDTGIRGILGLEMRHLTPAGDSLNLALKASQVENDLEFHYIIPGKKPATDRFDLSAAAQTRNEKLGKSRVYKGSAGYITKAFEDWQQSIRLNLQQEKYQLDPNPWKNSLFLFPSYNLSRVKVDDPVKTRRGSRLNLNLQGAVKDALSTTDFFQGQLDAKVLYPLSSVNMLVMRGTVGYTAVHNLVDLPMSFQYFAGGTQSVRGYGYNNLGPGKDLILASAEVRQRVFGDWYLTGFFDCGNADNSFQMKLKRGAGAGIAWLSPIGTMQLSYAVALDSPNKPGLVQFSMGPEF